MKRTMVILASLYLTIFAALDRASSAQQADKRETGTKPPRNVAILIFEGVQIIDYTGPWETLGHTYFATQPVPFKIYTVAEKPEALTTEMGMSVNPNYTIANAPKPDILIVPGGGINDTRNNPKVMKWLQDSAKDAEIVMSVCNGAFILAKAGLLDGLEATTTALLLERFKEVAPKTKVVSDKRFVDTGKIITTGGLSSGIDGALHIIERLYGRGTAEMVALTMEYDWDPESKFVRAVLADKYLPVQYDIESVTKSWVPLSRTGGTDRWESKWLASSQASAAKVLDRVEAAFSHPEYFPRVRNVKWVKQAEDKSSEGARSRWKFTDENGKPWAGSISVDPMAGQKNVYTVSVGVEAGDRSHNGTE